MIQDSTRKFLIVTDLDSSLLDEDYGYEGALDALQMLRDRGYPLVLNSSKTYAELRELAHELGQCDAVVAENGGLIAIRQGSAIAPEGDADHFGYIRHAAGMLREEILALAHDLRARGRYSFEGFSDWSVSEVVNHTGLSTEAAIRAMDRETTEPIHWHGSDAELKEFLTSMEGVKALRGGRFIHLMGDVDKVLGMRYLLDKYQKAEPGTHWTVVAVGDSANDKAMLEAADIAVVIPHADGVKVEPENPQLTVASEPGSKGWGQIISKLLNNRE